MGASCTHQKVGGTRIAWYWDLGYRGKMVISLTYNERTHYYIKAASASRIPKSLWKAVLSSYSARHTKRSEKKRAQNNNGLLSISNFDFSKSQLGLSEFRHFPADSVKFPVMLSVFGLVFSQFSDQFSRKNKVSCYFISNSMWVFVCRASALLFSKICPVWLLRNWRTCRGSMFPCSCLRNSMWVLFIESVWVLFIESVLSFF